MIKEFNYFILRLWRDDDGVMLALTVVVYLTLFVIGCSVFAVGEHLRQRIILQNAADTAAYSVAVVQADAISRIAALNRAMAWDYVQVCKMKRECILDKWVNDAYNAWSSDRNKVYDKAADNCNYTYRWYAGDYRKWQTEKIEFEGNKFSANNIRNRINAVSSAGATHSILAGRITPLLEAIFDINNKEEEIISALPKALDATFRSICEQNLDAGALTLFLRESAADYFEELPSTRDAENSFLSYAIDNTAVDEFGPGTNEWFILEASGRINSEGVPVGFSRNCTVDPILQPTAIWIYGWQKWRNKKHYYYVQTPEGPKKKSYKSCDYIRNYDYDDFLKAERYTFRRVFAYPQRLTSGFFAGDGTLVVAVALPLRNPLSVMMASLDQPGIFDFFAPSSDRESYMWAVSAARAGYRVCDADGNPAGAYAVVPDHEDLHDSWGKVNLSEQDWDAVLLPLRRARSSYGNNGWQSPESGQRILGEVWESTAWQAVGGGVDQSIRNAGNDIPNYSDPGINRLIWH